MVETRAQAVNCGERPVAEVTVQNVYLHQATDAAEKEGLQVVTVGLGEHHANLYIFKHQHLRRVIEQMLARSRPTLALSELDDWMWGKLFGYGEQEIGEYIDHCDSRGSFDKATP